MALANQSAKQEKSEQAAKESLVTLSSSPHQSLLWRKENLHAPWSSARVHADRVARRDRHYRHPRRHPLSGLRAGPGEGTDEQLPLQPAPAWHSVDDVRPGLR